MTDKHEMDSPVYWSDRKALGHMIRIGCAALVVAFCTSELWAQELEDDGSPPPDADMPLSLEIASGTGPVTHLPLPRYVSLKASEGNARRGPSISHRIDWVFKHQGMPLKLTAEFGNWRRVEDRDGAGGWIHYTLISGVRTVVFEDDKTELHSRPDAKAPITAQAESGAIARLDKCSVDWCEVHAQEASGWVEKAKIWGVDPQETRD